MALGQCTICCDNQAKYKCPKCPAQYCSLSCYKAPSHVHDEVTETPNLENVETVKPDLSDKRIPSKFEKVLADPTIQNFLKYKSLKVHLAIIAKILEDSSLTNEPLAVNRKDIANMRLCDLRKGGSEENELVEEFVARTLQILAEE